LAPNTEVVYKVSAYYAPAAERGLRWNDPKLGIDWRVKTNEATLSERDEKHPMFADLPAEWLF
jgi:dTDP-4-dehydrorhamnose 3,5-epimerase